MSSLEEHLALLKSDLAVRPVRIAAHSDMPFAIFRHAPAEEFTLRAQLRLFAIDLEQHHDRRVTFISLSALVWRIVADQGGADYLFKTEAMRGFDAAQRHVNQLLSSADFRPIADAVIERMASLDPEKDAAFLVRAGGFAPFIYRSSVLLDGMHRRTQVPVVLFYPGSAGEGTDLRFYDIPSHDGLGVYNYRVKVYGARS